MRVRDIEVGDRIGESSTFRIYLGMKDNGQPVILKVAKTFEDGAVLTREASRFNVLRGFEGEISRIETAGGHGKSHYDWLFANLVSSFMEPTQGDRRINVFAMPDIDLSKLIPLTKLHGQIEIDVRTSVWILGRLFKFYSFFELFELYTGTFGLNISKYPVFSPDDYLIGPERHRLIYYNFSGDTTDAVATDLVKTISKFIFDWVVTRDDFAEQKYLELLKGLSEYGRVTFEKAHGDLYRLVERLWGIQYHPFTYRDRDAIVWKTIKED